MKKWSEIKESVEFIDSHKCPPQEVAEILQNLVEWLDEYFYGKWREIKRDPTIPDEKAHRTILPRRESKS